MDCSAGLMPAFPGLGSNLGAYDCRRMTRSGAGGFSLNAYRQASLQRRSHSMLGPKQARLGRRHGQTQHCSGLSDVKVRDTTKGIYILQAFREFPGRIGESTIDFQPPCQVFGGWRPVRKSHLGSAYLILVRVRAEVPPLWSAEISETLILNDSCDPRVELSVASKLAEVLEGS